MSLRASGSHVAVNIMRDVITKTPKKAAKYQATLKASMAPEVSADVVLNYIISGKLTNECYYIFRITTNANWDSVISSYHKILKAKPHCYNSMN